MKSNIYYCFYCKFWRYCCWLSFPLEVTLAAMCKTLILVYPQILIKYFIFLRQCKVIRKHFGKTFVFLLLLLLFWLWRFGGKRFVITQACLYQFLFFILQKTEAILIFYVFEHFWQFFLFDQSSSFDKNSMGIIERDASTLKFHT